MSRAPIFVRVWRGHLVPADAYAQQQIDELGDGKEFNARLSRITATGKEEREGQRGLWWAGCELLSQNTDEPGYYSKRAASDSILEGLGWTRRRYRRDGKFDMDVPISIADDALPDEEFAIMQELARAFCEEKFGFDPFQMWINEQDAKKGNAQAAQRGRR